MGLLTCFDSIFSTSLTWASSRGVILTTRWLQCKETNGLKTNNTEPYPNIKHKQPIKQETENSRY